MIHLAVLDLAGTTVRDDGIVETAFAEALAGMGLAPDGPELDGHLEHVRATMGRPKITVLREVFAGDEARAQEANQRLEVALAAAIDRGELAPLPGAEDTLRVLRDAGVRVCLTTGFSRGTTDQLVARLGWRELVDLVLAPGAGLRGRPYPDLILRAVVELEVDAVQDVAVAGDTVHDLVAGTRAGATIVAGVLTGVHGRAALEAAPHTHILESVVGLPAVVASLR